MCGIVGIINLNKASKNAESLGNMTKAIKHRGPDDEGYALISDLITPFFGDDSITKDSKHINTSFRHPFKVGFGFRQLKIIDLSNNSHQPMTDGSSN